MLRVLMSGKEVSAVFFLSGGEKRCFDAVVVFVGEIRALDARPVQVCGFVVVDDGFRDVCQEGRMVFAAGSAVQRHVMGDFERAAVKVCSGLRIVRRMVERSDEEDDAGIARFESGLAQTKYRRLIWIHDASLVGARHAYHEGFLTFGGPLHGNGSISCTTRIGDNRTDDGLAVQYAVLDGGEWGDGIQVEPGIPRTGFLELLDCLAVGGIALHDLHDGDGDAHDRDYGGDEGEAEIDPIAYLDGLFPGCVLVGLAGRGCGARRIVLFSQGLLVLGVGSFLFPGVLGFQSPGLLLSAAVFLSAFAHASIIAGMKRFGEVNGLADIQYGEDS